MAGLGQALMILGGAGAGGFKAAGDVAEEEVKGIKTDMLQAALDKRADNLIRFQAEEAEKGRSLTAREGRLGRRAVQKEGKLGREATLEAARIKAGEPGTEEQKYNLIEKLYGAEAKEIYRDSLKSGKTGAAAKAKLDAIEKMGILRDAGAPLAEINQVARAGGVEDWVVQKIMTIEKHWYGDKEVEKETYGPPGILGGTAKKVSGTAPKEAPVKGKTSLAELESLLGDQPATTQKPGLVAPKEKPPTEEELGGLLRKSETHQTGIGFKPEEFKPGAMPTIAGKVKDWTSQTIPKGRRKMGRTDLENAIEMSGFGKTYDEVKDMAVNLKKKYPNLSEVQLIELVKKVAAGE